MSSILSILGALGSGIMWVINFFHDRAIRQAEDQKIEVGTVKGELVDVKAELDSRDAIHNDPASVRDDPDNYATHPER